MKNGLHADRQLVERLAQGNEQAVNELADRYGAWIFQVAVRLMQNHEDAEEVTQDTLLTVVQKIHALRSEAALSSWIYRVTFNIAMSRLRSVRFSRPAEVPAAYNGTSAGEGTRLVREVADRSSWSDERLFREQMRRRLASAVRDLPPRCRTAVVLRDLEGLSAEEASSRLHITRAALKSRLHRGRVMLRERLAEFDGGLTLHRAA